jgi:hypothetical protein
MGSSSGTYIVLDDQMHHESMESFQCFLHPRFEVLPAIPITIG